METGLYVINKN